MLWLTSAGSNMDPFFLWNPIAAPCGASSVGLNWHYESNAENFGSVEVNSKTLTDFSEDQDLFW